jgi:hypothetical protein
MTDELQFFGQTTETAKAKVIDTQMHHIGYGKYFQRITYEFEYKRVKYKDTFEAGKRFGKQKTGNFILVKFSTQHPERSKVLYSIE